MEANNSTTLKQLVKDVDWAAVIEVVDAQGSSRKSSGIVDAMRDALVTIMADGKPRDVAKIQGILYAGLNADRAEDEEEVVVNWSTVKHALLGGPYVQVSHNVFTNGGVAKPKGKRSRK